MIAPPIWDSTASARPSTNFNDYSFVPDNLQLMTYLTALCPNIDLGTAAVILPWHDPLRVADRRLCSTC
jgi:alkanesulfonate monooxygenase SsuD/methylene tetrahydromethanopterin reductase-like flavin-dependent oxidoreductase (luciferase family)